MNESSNKFIVTTPRKAAGSGAAGVAPAFAPPASGPLPPLCLTLRDGTPVRIRGVRADDHDRVVRGFREMSQTSRYLRFFASAREISDAQARYLTEVDQVNHVAICAVDPTGPEERGYGISRFVRDAEHPRAAEFAVAVIDEMQGRGLGTLLVAALYLSAQAAGICELHAEVLSENPVMPRWMSRLGATVGQGPSPAYRRIRWAVRPEAAAPSPRCPEFFRACLERLRAELGAAAGEVKCAERLRTGAGANVDRGGPRAG